MRALRLTLLLVSLLLVSLPVAARATEVAGVKLPERATLDSSELVLNGAGVQKRFFLKVYVASLYLAEKTASAKDALALPGAKRLSIRMLRNLPTRKLVDGLEDGIRDNSSPAEQHAVQARVDELGAHLLAFGQAREGDVVSIDWRPDTGTVVLLNGEVRDEPIPGEDLYRAVLKVWLGERPTGVSLKKALLGQAQ